MYWVKTPKIIQTAFPKFLWKVRTEEKKIFLTFDDGPNPQATEFVLENLAKYQAKATFFLIGKNIDLHPTTAKNIQSEGHLIGNHTFTHCNGWKTSCEKYIQNFQDCQKQIEDTLGISTSLFRPPYGKITPSQAKIIAKTHKIVMMDILCGDFDLKRNAAQCTEGILRHSEKGSIIVYHDSEKAFPRLKPSLPEVLAHFHKENWTFETLPLTV